MTSVGVKMAWQRGRHDAFHTILCKPPNDAIVQLPKSRTVFFGHYVLIERAHDYQDVIAARLKESNQPLKGGPLQ